MVTFLSHPYFLMAFSIIRFHALHLAAAGAETDRPLNLTFILITSNGRYGFNSSGTLPAADIALERINSRPDLLPGYHLMYDTVRNSEVSYMCSDYDLYARINYAGIILRIIGD